MARPLSEDKREWILEDYKAGMTVAEISKSEGIVEPTIRKIIEEFIEIHPDETPAERLEKSQKKKRGKKAKAEKNEKKAEKPAPFELIAGLSYGEQKAAALDPAYIPQRMAPAATSSNPFLGKSGHIDGTNTPPRYEDDKPDGLLFGYSRELEALNRAAAPERQGEDPEISKEESESFNVTSEELPEDPDEKILKTTAEITEAAEPAKADRKDVDEKRLAKWTRVYFAGLIVKDILAGKCVMVANLRSNDSKIPVGVYDADDLEIWQLRELLANEDAIFFAATE